MSVSWCLFLQLKQGAEDKLKSLESVSVCYSIMQSVEDMPVSSFDFVVVW